MEREKKDKILYLCGQQYITIDPERCFSAPTITLQYNCDGEISNRRSERYGTELQSGCEKLSTKGQQAREVKEMVHLALVIRPTERLPSLPPSSVSFVPTPSVMIQR